MEAEIFKNVAQIVGIGGVSLAVLMIVFKSIIRKQIFPTLSEERGYRLLRLMIVCTFIIALVGIAAWVYADTKIRTESANNATNNTQIQREPLLSSPDNRIVSNSPQNQEDVFLQTQLDKLEVLRDDGTRTVKNISGEIMLEGCLSQFKIWKSKSVAILKQIDARLEQYDKATDFAGGFDGTTNTLVSDDLVRLRNNLTTYNVSYSADKPFDLCKSGFRASIGVLPTRSEILYKANIR